MVRQRNETVNPPQKYKVDTMIILYAGSTSSSHVEVAQAAAVESKTPKRPATEAVLTTPIKKQKKTDADQANPKPKKAVTGKNIVLIFQTAAQRAGVTYEEAPCELTWKYLNQFL